MASVRWIEWASSNAMLETTKTAKPSRGPLQGHCGQTEIRLRRKCACFRLLASGQNWRQQMEITTLRKPDRSVFTGFAVSIECS